MIEWSLNIEILVLMSGEDSPFKSPEQHRSERLEIRF